MEYTKIAELGL